MIESQSQPPVRYAIEARGLSKQYDDIFAVQNLDLKVAEGEFFGFLGPNGAGKSTTMKMLVGLLRPTSGDSIINGYDMWRDPLTAKKQIGVLPEGLTLYPRLTAREFIHFSGTMYGLSRKVVEQRTNELLDIVDLQGDADKLIVDYSHGMRKKTALAAAIIHGPKVLFLDEPFEGVDAITIRAIRGVLQQLRDTGTTIFFSSHILEIVEKLCTRVAVINNGQLVTQGTIPEMRALATTSADSSLEELFLKAVGAEDAEDDEGLSWLR